MGFLLSLVLIIFFVALFILFAVIGFLRSLLSFRWLKKNREHSDTNYQQQSKKPKVFDQNEGEYTDFEEIK